MEKEVGDGVCWLNILLFVYVLIVTFVAKFVRVRHYCNFINYGSSRRLLFFVLLCCVLFGLSVNKLHVDEKLYDNVLGGMSLVNSVYCCILLVWLFEGFCWKSVGLWLSVFLIVFSCWFLSLVNSKDDK